MASMVRFLASSAGHVAVQHQVLLNLVANGQHGVQARHGLLKDHADAATAHLTHHFTFRVIAQQVIVHALQANIAARHTTGAGNQLQNAQHGNGLAAAALTHDTDDLAAIHMKADALNGIELLSVRAEGSDQILDLK